MLSYRLFKYMSVGKLLFLQLFYLPIYTELSFLKNNIAI